MKLPTNIPLTIFGLIIAAFLIMHFIPTSKSAGTIDEMARQSETLKSQADSNLELALKLDCLRVSARITACYESNDLCPRMWQADVWFLEEWNLEHQILCTSTAQEYLNNEEEIPQSDL